MNISWGNLAREVGDTVNPFNGDVDYDISPDISVAGGARNNATGGVWGVGAQGQVNPGWTPSQGGYVLGQNTGNGGQQPVQQGGGDSGGSSTRVVADPYARWGGKANFDAMRGQYGATQGGYEAGARQSATDTGNTYDQKSRDWVNSIQDEQSGINREGAQNQLNLRQSMGNIVRGIQQGIKSGNVSLAGMNALSSGAAEALARAYAKVGNQQTGEARGQAASVTDDLALKQGTINRKREEGVNDLNTFRDTETGRIRGDFSNKLGLLKSDAESKGVGDVVNTGLVDQVIGEAMARLQQIDQTRNQRLSGIKSLTPDEIMQEAIRMEQAGQAGDAFQVADTNVSYGNGQSGAQLSQVPIYMKNRDQFSQVPTASKKQQ